MTVRDVFVTLDGHELRLRFDLGAWAALEDRGYELDGLLKDYREGRFSFRSVRALLWAMLLTNEPTPALEEVGHWVDGHNFESVVQKLGAALETAFPQLQEASAGPFVPGVGPRPEVSAPGSASVPGNSGISPTPS